MKTLVIHPSDRTTDFLDTIYKDLDALVIRGAVRESFLMDQMEAADRIYMLGHGMPQGLLGHGTIMVDAMYTNILRKKKNLVGIWCNADAFFTKYGLNGLYTGMIVSEKGEANIFIKGSASQVDINESNVRFAHAVREGLEVFDPEIAAAQVIESYEKPSTYQWNYSNRVVMYNAQNIYDSGGSVTEAQKIKEEETVCA